MARFNPDIHRRRSIRLNGYDYSKVGAYFVTLCTWSRECYFEQYPRLKEIVEGHWKALPETYKGIILDEYVIMPNHLHGIIMIKAKNRAGASPAPTEFNNNEYVGAPLAGALSAVLDIKHKTIGDIVGSFKSMTSNEWLKIIKSEDINTRGKFWQRNYYEHIIRDEDELNCTRQYIIENPLKWEMDAENPANAEKNVL